MNHKETGNIKRIYTLYGANEKQIYLVPFEKAYEEKRVQLQYKIWLNDTENLKSIASQTLLGKKKDKRFFRESYERFTKHECYGFFIYDDSIKEYIGTAKLEGKQGNILIAEDGILIGEQTRRGAGIGTEVYRILLTFGFETLGLRKISGGCSAINIPMINIFKTMGYKHEGAIRKVDNVAGDWIDHYYFGIFNEEFRLSRAIEIHEHI